MLTHCLLVLALLAAQSAPAWASAADAPLPWRAAAQQPLIVRGDAGSLATAATLAFGQARLKTDPAKPEAAAADLAARAAALAPQSPAIGWVHLQLCAQAAGCDIRDAATTLRWVDADNAAAWLPSLAAAQKDKDTVEIDRILADMAQGARFDLYGNRIVVLMVDSLKKVRNDLPRQAPRSDLARLWISIGIVGEELLPSFSPLLEICREPSAGTERRDACLKVSKIMQRSDAVIAQMGGFALEKRLVAPDGKEAQAIAERRRVLEWRRSAAAQFDTTLLPWVMNARARSRLAHMRALPREEDVCLAILREHGMATEPPENH
jgi:hypothetical protein